MSDCEHNWQHLANIITLGDDSVTTIWFCLKCDKTIYLDPSISHSNDCEI